MQQQTVDEKDSGRFDFMGKSTLFGLISALSFVVAVVIIGMRGFNYGIDFTGGVEAEIHFENKIPMAELRSVLEKLNLQKFEVSDFGNSQDFTIRFEGQVGKDDDETNALLNQEVQKTTQLLSTSFPDNKANIRRVDTVGPQVGNELKRNGLLATFYALVLILVYIGVRFDFRYAFAAVLCLFHDTVVTLGIFSLVNYEINVQIIAAVLTLIGYSLCLYFIAGGVIRDIALTFIIGIVLGTYSSIWVATPLVLFVDKITGKIVPAKA